MSSRRRRRTVAAQTVIEAWRDVLERARGLEKALGVLHGLSPETLDLRTLGLLYLRRNDVAGIEEEVVHWRWLVQRLRNDLDNCAPHGARYTS